MFRVEWLQLAVDQLSDLWLQADAELRQSLVRATNEIDRSLRREPLELGESRSSDRRIAFFPPLTVTFRVNADDRVVQVLAIRLFRRRST
jgi:hypothetical protein